MIIHTRISYRSQDTPRRNRDLWFQAGFRPAHRTESTDRSSDRQTAADSAGRRQQDQDIEGKSDSSFLFGYPQRRSACTRTDRVRMFEKSVRMFEERKCGKTNAQRISPRMGPLLMRTGFLGPKFRPISSPLDCGKTLRGFVSTDSHTVQIRTLQWDTTRHNFQVFVPKMWNYKSGISCTPI